MSYSLDQRSTLIIQLFASYTEQLSIPVENATNHQSTIAFRSLFLRVHRTWFCLCPQQLNEAICDGNQLLNGAVLSSTFMHEYMFTKSFRVNSSPGPP